MTYLDLGLNLPFVRSRRSKFATFIGFICGAVLCIFFYWLNVAVWINIGSSQTCPPCVSSFSLQSVVTVEDGKLVHVQRWNGKETTLVREVNGNNLTLVSAQQPRARVSTSKTLSRCILDFILFYYLLKILSLPFSGRRSH